MVSMLRFPDFDPIAFSLGPLPIRWYGLMYLLGFFLVYLDVLSRMRAYKEAYSGFDAEQVVDTLTVSTLGILFGGRIFYLLFYQPVRDVVALARDLIHFWEPGRSFHGGFLGVVLALAVFARMRRISLLRLGDLFAVSVPLGLLCGRVGNFINGELWGRCTQMPWGMVFYDAGPCARHPSQLYQAALEGVLLWVMLRMAEKRVSGCFRPGQGLGLFCVGYAALRFVGEYFREPDQQMGFIWGLFTAGQLLSLPLVAVGSFLYFRATAAEKGENRACLS